MVALTRKLEFVKSDVDQVRPHVSEGLPRITVCSVVVSSVSVFAAVHVVPPSQDNSTSMRLPPPVLSSHQSSLTSMPLMLQASWMENP